MIPRNPIYPGILELNFQAREVLGCNVYLIYDNDQWALVDIGYEETVDDFVEIIRKLDFPLSRCTTLIATHADVDHIQGLAKIKSNIEDDRDGSSQCSCAPSQWRYALDACRNRSAGIETRYAQGRRRSRSARRRHHSSG